MSPPTRHPRPPRGRRRLVLAIPLAVCASLGALTVIAGAQGPAERKRQVDERLERAEERLRSARAREDVLTQQVAVYNGRIRQVEARLIPLRGRLSGLEAEVRSLDARLAGLNARLTAEKRRLAEAEDQLASRRRALADRLRYIYQQVEPDPITILLATGSVTQAVETQDLLTRISDRDGRLVTLTREHAAQVRASRDAIRRDRDEVQRAEERAAAAAAEVRSVTDELEGRRAELDEVRDGRRILLARVRGDREEVEAETRDLRQRSAALAARIVQAQTGSTQAPTVVRTPSSAGMIWPVNGTFTSGFGPRWGRMHEGIDIAVPTGTPVAAAAAGTVISAGWGGGYGNLVVIDHGGGIATAYAHNSRLAVSAGMQVGQGSVIAYAGSTGHSTGPHVHFEVRVNGAATNPLNYL